MISPTYSVRRSQIGDERKRERERERGKQEDTVTYYELTQVDLFSDEQTESVQTYSDFGLLFSK